MSSKTNIGKPRGANRESGRRMYMSDDPYQEQMRRPVDKFFNNQIRVPHSENKKPYRTDSYGEMEYFAFPPWGFDFDWPQFPDSPVFDGEGTDPANPNVIRDDEPPDELLPFLGCVFSKPFTPNSINVGEVSTAELQPRDDRIIGAYLTGPCTLVVSPIGCIATLPFALTRSNCSAVIRAKSTEGYAPDPSSGLVDCVLVLQTASGSSCSAQATVLACDPENPVLWDSVNSAEYIDRESSVSVYVTGGTGPYSWSVSGTGFSMGSPTTSGGMNTLIADDTACGNASITVTDICDTSAVGLVQCTAGEWDTSATSPFGECECRKDPDEGTTYDGFINCAGWRIYEQKTWVFRCSQFADMGLCFCSACISKWEPEGAPCITGYVCPTVTTPCTITKNGEWCCDCTYNDPPRAINLVHCLNKIYQYKWEWIC